MGKTKSIIQEDMTTCYCQFINYDIFGCGGRLNVHHVCYGTSRRKISDKEGLVVALCYNHHKGTNGVHGKNGAYLSNMLKKIAQKKWEEKYIDEYPYKNHAEESAREQFRQMMGESYL